MITLRYVEEANAYKIDKEEGRVLSGFEDAVAAIYANQNPPDCSTASYLITRVENQSSRLLL